MSIRHQINEDEIIEILSADRVVADGHIVRVYDNQTILTFSQSWDGCFHFTAGTTRIHLCNDQHAEELAEKLKTCRKLGLMAIAKYCVMQTDWLTKT
jgi:hypothetical protein